MEDSRRIVLIGKTGIGKSSVGNTIFGETTFEINHSPNSQTTRCQAETRCVEGRSVTLIDTPGLFDTRTSDAELRRELRRCVAACAPGPHAFLVVLKVERYTHQEEDVVNKLFQTFSSEVFRYAAVLFTHGDQLADGRTIREFVVESRGLTELAKRCAGRCHIIDNKHWNNAQPGDNYRSNRFQVSQLLLTVEQIVGENRDGFFTKELLRITERKPSGFKRCGFKLVAISVGAAVGSLLGLAQFLLYVFKQFKEPSHFTEYVTSEGTGKVLAIGGGCAAVAGGIIGGCVGYGAADDAMSTSDAAKKATDAVWDKANAASKITWFYFGRT